MAQARILVLGDLILDEFVWGEVDRISPEAPVPVVRVTRESEYAGGAANVARNLADFGARSRVVGRVGDDGEATRLTDCLTSEHICTEGVVRVPGWKTSLKSRIIARQQQVVRVDRESVAPIDEATRRAVLDQVEAAASDVDALIIEDYGKGLLDDALVSAVMDITRQHGLIVTVDPNPANPLDWTGATLVKPNRREAFAVANRPATRHEEDFHAVAEHLLGIWKVDHLLMTLGEQGMLLCAPNAEPYHVPPRAHDVYDVSGAGDTSIAFITAALAAGIPVREAAEIANHAASVVVGKFGTATITRDELALALRNGGA